MQDSDKIVIAFIHPGTTSAYFATSMLQTILIDQNGPRRIVGLLQDWSSANVSGSRNKLTTDFLDDHTAEWLLWIDSDMGWSPESLDALLSSADAGTAPIVGGLCFGASDGELWPTMYRLAPHPDTGEPTTMRVSEYPADTLVQVAATGAAFLLIHRDVLVKMREHNFNDAFPFFQETSLGGKPCGEDLTFCLRALALELPVHVNTAARIGHHKSHLLDEKTFLQQKGLRDAEPVSG